MEYSIDFDNIYFDNLLVDDIIPLNYTIGTLHYNDGINYEFSIQHTYLDLINENNEYKLKLKTAINNYEYEHLFFVLHITITIYDNNAIRQYKYNKDLTLHINKLYEPLIKCNQNKLPILINKYS